MFSTGRLLQSVLTTLVGLWILSSASCSSEETNISLAAAKSVAVPATKPPDLILILSLDTLRADHLGLYGAERFTSPLLDEFAAGGTTFTDASSTSPWTLPSHASLLTGLYPINHRVLRFDSALPEDVTSIAGVLRTHGYKTGAVVNSSWLKREPFRLTRDFDDYLFVADQKDRRGPSTWVTDQAITWIQNRGDEPLFLFVHYYDVHADYSSLPEYEKLFVTPYTGPADGTAWQLAQASFEDDFLEMCHANYDPNKCRIGTLEEYFAVDRTVDKIDFDSTDVRHLEELYDAGIRQLDSEIGRLFSVLEDDELINRSLVIITSDHGEEFMDHGRMDHFLTVYQEVLRIPLIFRGQGIPQNLRIDTPVSLVDIFPTVLSIAGIPIEEHVDGQNLTSLMTEAEDATFAERFLYGEAAGGLSYELMMHNIYPVYRSVRQGQYKLIYDSKEDRSWLYDLSIDSAETKDLSESHPEIAQVLREEMARRYDDFSPKPDPADRVELDAEDIERLRSLGYLP